MPGEGLNPVDMEIVDMLRRVQEKKEIFYLVNKVDSPELEPSLLPPFYEFRRLTGLFARLFG